MWNTRRFGARAPKNDDSAGFRSRDRERHRLATEAAPDQVDAMTQALLRWNMVIPQQAILYYSEPYQISPV
jgi:hypothetical protein